MGELLHQELMQLYGSTPQCIDDIREKCMLFYIHNSYSPTLSEQELYDRVRQYWHQVSEKTRRENSHPIALGVVEGIVVRVYSIAGWFPAGATLSSRQFDKAKDKWEFVGQLLTDHPLVGRMLVDSSGKLISASQKGYSYLPKSQ